MILYYTADLLWASKIKATAEAEGLTARPVRTLEMLESRLAEYAEPNPDPVRALLVEIPAGETDDQSETPEVDKAELALAMIRRVRAVPGSGGGGITVLAFGPHVELKALRAAKTAGASVVMTRGGLASRMGAVLREVSGKGDAAQP